MTVLPSMATLIVAIAALTSSASPGRALDLIIIGEDLDTHSPVSIKVHRQEGADDVVLNASNPVPQFHFSETACSVSVKFMAEPVDPSLWNYNHADWRPCYQGQDFDFKFSKTIPHTVTFTQQPKTVVDVYTIEGSINGSIVAESITDPTLQPGLKVLRGLAVAGDYGSVSYVSNEMSIALANAGRTSQARSFRDLALATGIDSITKAGSVPTPPPADYWFAKGTDQPELSDAARAYVQQYQQSIGLKDAEGALDWPTLKATSNLASTDIEQLDALKRAAIAPFD